MEPMHQKYLQKLDDELAVIKNMGYVDYFLIVWDFIHYAREHDIMVGPGRGSAAGSLVSYTTGITDIDPVRYNLIFERFLNPERVSMPDIDVDFCFERRQEVIDYVVEKIWQGLCDTDCNLWYAGSPWSNPRCGTCYGFAV